MLLHRGGHGLNNLRCLVLGRVGRVGNPSYLLSVPGTYCFGIIQIPSQTVKAVEITVDGRLSSTIILKSCC